MYGAYKWADSLLEHVRVVRVQDLARVRILFKRVQGLFNSGIFHF